MAPADSNFQHSHTSSNTVCVINASGHLGSALVERLLLRGYTVHAAVQHDDEQMQFNGLSCENKKLKIFRSDPFDYHSITDALKGCSGLFYAFEPPQDQPIYDEFMVEVEVRAAHNVLEACAQTETIDRVVFTSSVTAVVWRDDRKSTASELDETHWSDVNFCRKYKLWHGLSKTLAEKTAWALAMDRGVNMVSVNAALMMGGPDVSITHPYLKGAAEMYEDGVLLTVDMNFLVDAHICVFENISSYGRYLCFNHVVNRHEDALKLAQVLTTPSAAPMLPQSYEQDMRIIQQRISNKKLNQLMVDFECGSQVH
ncbi:cinnamoyl-CoA reductase-like SNL6 [Juglans microcarpa x Juglans regia]|uniref:cinnamoyl-CoA reductase-like SNL6 n=1 Tax=Juglans microcarpa x Juglans regia TaxID=2249226 RepID=UPI001B7F5661|nr:cinnamoyl-CoA reductase-like SNL6 [Juglans microcarpa x Juglans regia]